MTASESHKVEFKYLGLFVLTAIFVGFTLGTLTLLGPVRWTVAAFRSRGFGESAESITVVIYILLLLIVSLIASSAIATYILGDAKRWKRVTMALGTVAAAVAANFFWTSPALMKKNMGAEEQLAMFTFGPYPDEVKLKELKDRGFTGVISLLHPAVVPFEPQLLRDERAAAARVGIPLIHTPMLPWVSDNRDSVLKIRELAGKKTGRYYVHCYLGLDRVLIVKRVVEQESSSTVLVTERRREALETRRFERGRVVKLGDSLFVGPYPTPEELLKIIGGKVENMVSLVDTSEPEHQLRLEEVNKAIAPFRLTHHVIRLSTAPYNAEAMRRTAEQVRAMQGITFVHEFYGPGTGRAPLAEAFLIAYRTGRAPIMPLLADLPLEKGEMRILDVDVVAGPRPAKSEINGRLVEAGVRSFVCLGGPSPECTADEKIVESMKLRHYTAVGEADLAEIMRGRGPFYVYEPGEKSPGDIVKRLAEQRSQAAAMVPVAGQ